MAEKVKLVERPADLAEFAESFAQMGPYTARGLAIHYLDQNLAHDVEDFDAAVEAFIPQCEYYC